METALNIASVVFVGTLLFGLLLLIYGAWGSWQRHRYALRAPTMQNLPTRALDEIRQAWEKLRTQYYRAAGDRRTRYGLEMHRLEMRMQHLQARTQEDQAPYYQLCRRREKGWRDWKRVFDHVDTLRRRERRHALVDLAELARRYHEIDKQVQDEWHRALARDELNLEELHAQGALASAMALTQEGARHEAEAEPPPERAEGEALEGGALADLERKAAAHPAKEPPPPDAEAEGKAGAPAGGAPQGSPRGAQAREMPRDQGPPAMGEMHQADFDIPDLPKAGLRYADRELSLAALPGGMLHDANVSGASFAGVRFTGAHHYRSCTFNSADFRAASLPQAEQPHQFVDCDFTGATFALAHIEYTLFLRCNFSYTQWRDAQLNRVKFSACRIGGADWEGVDLSRTIMTAEMVSQGDLSRASRPPHIPEPTPYDAAAAESASASRTAPEAAADSTTDRAPASTPPSAPVDTAPSSGEED